MIYGVTGKSGSGKNRFSDLLCGNNGMKHIDIDTIGHRVLEIPEVVDAVRNTLGLDIITNGQIDRKHLGNIVFENREKHKQLSQIIWPRMKELIDEEIARSNSNCVLNWILLPHTEYFKLCDVKILLLRDNTKRIASLKMRDGINDDDITRRDKASIAYNHDEFDYIVQNGG